MACAIALSHDMIAACHLGAMCPRIAFLVCTRTDMVIDEKEKDLFGESPSKGDPRALDERPCLSQSFLL